MRLALVTDSLAPSDGPGRYASNLVGALAPFHDAIDVAVPVGHPPLADTLPDSCRLHRILPSRHLYYLRWPLFYPLVIATALRLAPLVRRSDLVHSVKDYPFSLIAALAASWTGRPFVTSAFGTYGVMPLGSRKHRRCLRWVYRRARRVLCISSFTAERLRPEVEDRKLTVLPTGVDPAFLGTGPMKRAHPRPYVLGVGLVRDRKGFDISIAAFLEIAREHENLDYVIVGGLQDEACCRRLRAMLASHPEGHRVHLVGQVDESRLKALYGGCELFILTPRHDDLGRFEGLGLVYLEAGALARAVIGTTGCGAEDAVVDDVTGILVAPGDVQATAGALRRLLGEPELRRRLGAEGRRRVESFTWPAIAKRVDEVYSDAVG